MHSSWQAAAIILGLAVLLDWFAGEYPHLLHPVVWIGKSVNLLLRLAPAHAPPGDWWPRFLFGLLLVTLVGALTAACSILAMLLVRAHLVAEVIVGALLLKASFALRELGRAAQRVAKALQSGDLAEARQALRSLCSRDPSELEAKELLAGTVESLAENASDSFVAPLFYYLLLGVPGALVYRAINTMDAMIGYRGEYEALGKTAARLDDLANWLPARLTAALLLLSGWLCGNNRADGWRILRRDGGKTASPNAGRPMAVMAGLLRVQLEKQGAYSLGDPIRELTPAMVGEAWRMVVLAALLLLALEFSVLCSGALA